MARRGCGERDGHSSGTPVARRLKQPTRAAGPDRPRDKVSLAPAPLLFGLAPGGVYRAVSVAGNAVRSCRTVSPLPQAVRYAPEAVCFSVALSLGLPPPDVIRHRSSVEPGLSSPPPFRDFDGAAVQPTDPYWMGTKRREVKSAVRRLRPRCAVHGCDARPRAGSAASTASTNRVCRRTGPDESAVETR
jgi:hypothetical protein